jgi:predicted Zn-ribbon and HTH transcriptional regulator
MGRSYWFECPRCGYRAKVSGRVDRGLNLFVQTVACQDCKELYDAVTRIRVPADSHIGDPPQSNLKTRTLLDNRKRPPTFLSAMNRLTTVGGKNSRWIQFPAQCPVASFHRVRPWIDPDKCPRCGIFLEKNVLPYRIWE